MAYKLYWNFGMPYDCLKKYMIGNSFGLFWEKVECDEKVQELEGILADYIDVSRVNSSRLEEGINGFLGIELQNSSQDKVYIQEIIDTDVYINFSLFNGTSNSRYEIAFNKKSEKCAFVSGMPRADLIFAIFKLLKDDEYVYNICIWDIKYDYILSMWSRSLSEIEGEFQFLFGNNKNVLLKRGVQRYNDINIREDDNYWRRVDGDLVIVRKDERGKVDKEVEIYRVPKHSSVVERVESAEDWMEKLWLRNKSILRRK